VIRAISALFGAVAYAGLAIVGWGGARPLFSHPARTAAIAVLFVLTVAGLIAPGGNLSTGVREDRANRWVLPVFTVLGLFNAWLPAFTERRDIWIFDSDATRWLGVSLLSVGGFLRIWPVYVLRNRFSGLVAIQPGHALVTTGVYGTIRHPSYLGLLIMSIGWSLVFRSGAGVLVSCLIVPPLVARMNAEERLLLSEFNGEYEAYRQRTWRLLPGIY
jgi:protein-S-isoprenylcysteine O-methyltransferase Ste14